MVKTSHLERDYIYTKDIARGLVAFLKSDVSGIVNICTGRAIRIGDFAMKFAQALGRESLLDVREEETSQPPVIVGDDTRLRQEVGYQIEYSHEMAVKDILRG